MHDAYVTNLHEWKSTGTNWIALYVNIDNATYFDSFRSESISKEIKKIFTKYPNKN